MAHDFFNSNNRWDRQRNADGITDYENDQYLIHVNRTDENHFADLSLILTDVGLEVEAVNTSEISEYEFDLIRRFQNKNDFYANLISSDGYNGIHKVNGIQPDVRQDADFSKGVVGLLAGDYQTAVVKILIDNFVVNLL